MMAAIGEEIGWRGFLVPELAKWMSVPKTALVSGAIRCVWQHARDLVRFIRDYGYAALVSNWLLQRNGSVERSGVGVVAD